MADTTQLDVELLHALLCRAVTEGGGCRASRLLRSTPELIELLCPAGAIGCDDLPARALTAETLIRSGIAALGGGTADALSVLLALAPGTVGRSLKDRRRAAGREFGVQGETFSHANHEKALLFDLSLEIYRLWMAHNQQPD